MYDIELIFKGKDRAKDGQELETLLGDLFTTNYNIKVFTIIKKTCRTSS